MIRQNIILGDFTYIVDLYKGNSDLSSNEHYEEFVILKKNDILNNIMFERDVFFVKKSILDKCTVDGSLDFDKLGTMVAFPITNNLITMSYSSNYKAFNPNYTENTFDLENDIDAISMYDKLLSQSTNVLCDKIRIWLPITNSKLQSLIHISNVINDIRFHYVCENLGNYETNAESELKIGNDIYSEYIELWIPNIEDLFSPSKHYMKENYNVSQFKQKIIYKESNEKYITIYPCIHFEIDNGNIVKKLAIEAFKTYAIDEAFELKLVANDDDETYQSLVWPVNSMSIQTFDEQINDNDTFKILLIKDNNVINEYKLYESEILCDYDNESLYCSTFLMILPFFIDNDGMQPRKTYFNTEKDLLDNILANPIVMSLYPFYEINAITQKYEASGESENSDVFTLSKDIKMSISFEFNNDINDGESNYGAYMLNCKFICNKKSNETLEHFYLDKLKLSRYEYNNDDIIDNGEYDDEVFNPKIYKCGYVIEMSNNASFKDIIYEYVINIDTSDENTPLIEDTKFKLNFELYDNMWNAYPESLVVRVKYVDKISYTIIGSNPLFVTKEKFKHIINNGDNRLMLIDSKQGAEQISKTKYDEIFNSLNNEHEANNEELENMNLSYFNFIDKVNCTIISKEQDSANTLTNSKTNQRVVYKPVFYKVKDLQQIKLKNGISQNVGLNLSDILSKVDTFKVIIEGNEFPEIARNDAYVIFRVNSQILKSTSGQYNLIDQDNQFISDGTWYIY